MRVPSERHLATVAEYFRDENAADNKHEYRDGEVIAMAGSSFNHSLIAMNFGREFGNALKGTPCRVLDSNLRIGIPNSARYTYPDLSVICGPPQLDSKDPGGMTVTNPRIIVEVLSPSTEAKDRGEKFIKYQNLESLEEYVLISQDQPRVELFSRKVDATWVFKVFAGPAAILRLESVQAQVALADLYEGVEFPPESNPES